MSHWWDTEKKALNELIQDYQFISDLYNNALERQNEESARELLRIFNGCWVYNLQAPPLLMSYICNSLRYIQQGYNPYEALNLPSPLTRSSSLKTKKEEFQLYKRVRDVMNKENKSANAAAEAISADSGISEGKLKSAYRQCNNEAFPKTLTPPTHLIFSNQYS